MYTKGRDKKTIEKSDDNPMKTLENFLSSAFMADISDFLITKMKGSIPLSPALMHEIKFSSIGTRPQIWIHFIYEKPQSLSEQEKTSHDQNSNNNNNSTSESTETLTKTFVDKTHTFVIKDFKENSVLNLSDHTLTQTELTVLKKGLNFAPTPKPPDIGEIKTEVDNLIRRMCLKLHFADIPYSNIGLTEHQQHIERTFRNKSSWTPAPNADVFLESFVQAIKQDLFDIQIKNIPAGNINLTPEQYDAITALKNNKWIVIKKADKGSATVVMNHNDYIKEGVRQLSDAAFYQKLEQDPLIDHQREIENTLLKIHQKGEISRKVLHHLLPSGTTTPEFYFLPKIHKTNITGRPIISGNNSPTERISAFVDEHIKILIPKIKSYVRDTPDFIRNIEEFRQTGHYFLVTMDVTSLYTNIPNHEGLVVARGGYSLYIGWYGCAAVLTPFFWHSGDWTRSFWGTFSHPLTPKRSFGGAKTTNPYRIRSFWPQIPFFPRSFGVQFSVASGTPPSVFGPSTPPPPGVAVARSLINEQPKFTITYQSLLELLRLVLYKNNFNFNEEHYLQIGRTAMGTKVAPSLANLFMGRLEEKLLKTAEERLNIKLPLYKRYIEDIFFIFPYSEDKLKDFMNLVNSEHRTIKFTEEHSLTEVVFLDCKVKRQPTGLYTDLYIGL